jgi:hypothetical protein
MYVKVLQADRRTGQMMRFAAGLFMLREVYGFQLSKLNKFTYAQLTQLKQSLHTMPSIQSNKLKVNEPIQSTDDSLLINHNEAGALKPGVYEFQLQVTDDSGNQSAPTVTRVIVVDDKRPTAVLDAPSTASFGDNITLSAKRSVDIGGKIASYEWTLIKQP